MYILIYTKRLTLERLLLYAELLIFSSSRVRSQESDSYIDTFSHMYILIYTKRLTLERLLLRFDSCAAAIQLTTYNHYRADF